MANWLKTIHWIFLGAMIFTACGDEHEVIRSVRAPKRTKANPIVIPANQLTPTVVKAGPPVITPAGEPTLLPETSKRYKLGSPAKFGFGEILTHVLGEDTIPEMELLEKRDSTARLGIPIQQIANPPSIRPDNPINVSTYNKIQGLKQKNTKELFHDSKGNYWIGSGGYGLSKFDGKTFFHYTTDQGLSHNYITCVREDDQGRIWIGTRGGVTIIDGTNITYLTGHEDLENAHIVKLVKGQDGVMWICTIESGFFCYNKGNIKRLGAEHGLPTTTLREVKMDDKGVLWCLWYNMLVSFDGEKVIIRYFDFERALSPQDLDFDQDGSMWIADRYGIVHWNAEGLWFYGKEQGLIHMSCWSVKASSNGDLWFATPDGVMRYNGNYVTVFNEDEGLCEEYTWDIFEDNYGNIWMASGEACVTKYSEYRLSHLILPGEYQKVKTFFIRENDEGNLLLATRGAGLIKSDSSGLLQWNSSNGLPFNDLSCIEIDEAGLAYFSGYGGNLGFGVFDGDQFYKYGEEQGAPTSYLRAIELDQHGNLWMTHSNTGITYFDGENFTTYTQEDGLNIGDVYSILVDSKGNVWMGTGEGLAKFDGNQFTQYKEISAPTDRGVWCLMEDRHGDIWMGTRFGIVRFDGEHFTQINDEFGLSENLVQSLIEAEDGSFWMGTQFGVSRLKFRNPEVRLDTIFENDFHVSTYVYQDGFYGVDVSPKSICEDSTGTIWVGSRDRITRIHPEEMQTSPNITLEITGVNLFNEQIPWRQIVSEPDSAVRLENNAVLRNTEIQSLGPWYDIPLGLSLAHDNNDVNIDFAGITNKEAQKVRYRYKLEGRDEEWGGLTNATSANFGNLSSGSYTFRVKALDGQGNWSDEATYSFEIRPPWWNTWVARILYAVVLVGGILIYTRWRTRALKKQRTALETTVKKRTVELEEQKVRAEQSEQYKEQFLANMSHEIRTPMHAISGMTNILARNEKLEHQKKFLKAIQRSSENLLVILNDILDLSKIEAGKIEVESIPVNLRKVIENVVEIIRIRAEEKEVPLSYAIDPSLPKFIYGDPTRLSQILLNLMGNALKFTDEGRVHLELIVIGGKYRISVSDTGIGIPKAKLHTIFESFEQVNESTTRKYGGTGLGLSICRQLLELQNGSIRVESEEDKGSTFTFDLPLMAVDESDIVEREIGEEEIKAMTSELSGLRILLAEDNEFNVMVATDDLNYYLPDVQLDFAANGEEAVLKFRGNDYDMILMDMQMPVMDGYEATRVIREMESDNGIDIPVPIIAMTASLLKQEIDRCYEVGMDNYIPKPYKLEQLISVIHHEAKKPNPREQQIGS